jgi:hypothetical protein
MYIYIYYMVYILYYILYIIINIHTSYSSNMDSTVDGLSQAKKYWTEKVVPVTRRSRGESSNKVVNSLRNQLGIMTNGIRNYY